MNESHDVSRTTGRIEERRCRSLIENSFDVFKIIDAEGVIRFASPSVERVMGYAPDEVVGTSVFDWIHPDDVDLARSALETVLSKGALEEYVELRDRHRNGRYRTIEVVASNLIDDPAVGGVVLNYRDVTERKQWEAALRQSEERYQRVFQSSPDSITISFLSTGAFLEVNEGFEQITGYTRDEILGRTSLELGIWKSPEARSRLAERLRDEMVVRDFEAVFVTKDGHDVIGMLSATIIELHGAPCMLATVRDVTAQRRAEERLKQATDQLRREHEELKEKNIALKQILDHIEEDKNAYRHEIASSVESLLRPVIEKLRDSQGRLSPAEVETLRARLDAIIKNDIDQFQNNLAKLTPRELDICELIQEGRTSKEIAQQLGLSPETIHKHRQSIRRKLQLDHRGVNLSSYLRSR
jgi:PAS domain S-box-containing protein